MTDMPTSNRHSLRFLTQVLAATVMFIFWLANLNAQENDSTFQQGIDFSLVSKVKGQEAEQLSDLESVSNIEIFYWLGCKSCYQVELGISQYLEQHPALTLRRTPLVARSQWRAHAYVPLILSQLSLQLAVQLSEPNDVPTIIDLYKQCLTDCGVFKDYQSSLEWFTERLKPQSLPGLDEEQIWQSEKNFQKRADIFLITQVPTIIINERYKITAKQAQTTARLVEIIDYLIRN